MTNTNRSRQPKGVPVGGQFATETKSETEAGLGLVPGNGFEDLETRMAQLREAEARNTWAERTHARNRREDWTERSDAELFADEALNAQVDREYHGTNAEKASRFFPPYGTSLYFVDYDDQLTDQQIEDLLRGAEADVYESVTGSFGFGPHDSARNQAAEAWKEAYQAGVVSEEWPYADLDDQDEMTQLAWDRDTSDPVADLTRHTHKQLMRTRLEGGLNGRLIGGPHDAWYGLSTFNEDGPEAEARIEARRQAIAAVLTEYGLDTTTPEAQASIDELVHNGPYDWHEAVRLDVIFYSDVADATADCYEGSQTTLAFANPRVVLMDTMNGSGHDVQFNGTLTKTLPPMPEDGQGLDPDEAVFLDNGPSTNGYSWDEVCGLHKPAYDTAITRTVAGNPNLDKPAQAGAA